MNLTIKEKDEVYTQGEKENGFINPKELSNISSYFFTAYSRNDNL